MKRRVGYVIAAFEGRRPARTLSFEANDTLTNHLEALNACGGSSSAEVTDVLMVVNVDGFDERDASAEPVMAGEFGSVRYRVIHRPNRGFSYGAWEAGLMRMEQLDSPPDDYFVIEDDYVPSSPAFLDCFYRFVTPTTGFVAQKWARIPGVAPDHAAVSNGLIAGNALRAVIAEFGRPFSIYSGEMTAADHLMGCENQVTFLALFTSAGWEMQDISRTFSVPCQYSEGVLTERGKEAGVAPLRPITS